MLENMVLPRKLNQEPLTYLYSPATMARFQKELQFLPANHHIEDNNNHDSEKKVTNYIILSLAITSPYNLSGTLAISFICLLL